MHRSEFFYADATTYLDWEFFCGQTGSGSFDPLMNSLFCVHMNYLSKIFYFLNAFAFLQKLLSFVTCIFCFAVHLRRDFIVFLYCSIYASRAFETNNEYLSFFSLKTVH